ncbi:MAG: hypothetical protein ACC656_04650 [Candidatus Heimdallarchaeota archaeon]
MSHNIEWLFIASVLIYTLVSLSISIISLIYYRRGVKALNYIIAYFGLLAITGLFQFLTPFLHDKSIILGLYEGVSSPLAYNPVRNIGLLSFIVLFVFGEHILNDEINKFRLSIAVASISIYFVVLLYYIVNDKLIYVNDILPFAQQTRLDELAYDLVVYLSLLIMTYAFYKQYKNSVNSDYTSSIRLVYFALTFFTIAYLYEWMEHFFAIVDIDFVYFSLPVFIALAYVYTTNPHFAYYTPYNIHFLQITMNTGRLIYAADVKSRSYQSDFFLSFSLANINLLLTETLMSNKSDIVMERIKLNQGEIIFETIDDVILAVYTERSSRVLRKSMNYFIREFIDAYKEAIELYRKGIYENIIDDIDNLLKRCIPLLSSKMIHAKDIREVNYP